MSASALVTACLVEALLESVLYGVYGVLCITVLYLFRSRERRPAVWVSLGLVIQFFTITGHWICTLYAFVHLDGGDAAAAFYDNMSAPWYLTSLVFFGFPRPNCCISRRNRIPPRSPSLLTDQRVQYRALNRLSERIDGGVPLMSVLAVIAESAALQTAITIGALVMYHEFVGQVVFSEISPVVIGISTILIHARIGLGKEDVTKDRRYSPSTMSYAREVSGARPWHPATGTPKRTGPVHKEPDSDLVVQDSENDEEETLAGDKEQQYAPKIIAAFAAHGSPLTKHSEILRKRPARTLKGLPAMVRRHLEIMAFESPPNACALKYIPSAAQFLTAAKDLFLAILDAFRRRILHRNISADNILVANNQLFMVYP
ncbi:hypothetical protein GGX14DRAFT_595276 [Mycena pura]|uniref:Uncharacterized protein n=1 Tax=Mycena pura TaxID=153505 RepID=A0AAD6VNY1_9AGAR|nr:hypothetical protein GGX14DRAFT_595276 [Mycena pura]